MTFDPFHPTNCMSFRLRRATRIAARAYDAALRPLDLRNTQFTILGALVIEGPDSIGALAGKLATDATTLTRNLDVLVRRKLVQNSDGTNDARIRCVETTKKGRSLFEKALPLWRAAQKQIVDTVGRRRLADIASGLNEIEAAFAEPS